MRATRAKTQTPTQTHRKLVSGDNANGGNRGRDGRANRIRVERRKLVNHENDERKRVADGGADHDAVDEQRKDAGDQRKEERNHDRNGDGIWQSGARYRGQRGKENQANT